MNWLFVFPKGSKWNTILQMADACKRVSNLSVYTLMITLIALLLSSSFILSQVSKNGSLVYIVCVWAITLVGVTAYSLLKKRERVQYSVSLRRVLTWGALSFLGAFAVSLLTFFGTPAQLLETSSHFSLAKAGLFRTGLSFCAIYTVVLVFELNASTCREIARQLKQRIKKLLVSLHLTSKKAATVSFVLLFDLAASFISRYIGGLSFGVSFGFFLALSISLSYIVYGIAVRRVSASALFLSIAMPWALFMAVFFPTISGISWDDQIHYSNAQNLSYIINAPSTAAEGCLYDPLLYDPAVNNPQPYLYKQDTLSASTLMDYELTINDLYPASSIDIVRPGVGSALGLYNSIGYIPSALGLWIGRTFHFSLIATYILGRCCNALFYVAVSYVSIRILPCKKMLLCVIALFPGTIFLAANYSYDPWLICLLYLLVSMMVKAIVHEGKPYAFSYYAGMLLVGLVALSPKAVYFPLIFLTLLVPADRFQNRSYSRVFRYGVILTGAVVLLSFLAPFLLTGGGAYTDPRGVGEVSAGGQVQAIVSAPDFYISVIFDTLFNKYLTASNFDMLSYSFAYVSDVRSVPPVLNGMTLFAVIVTACIDSGVLANRISKVSYALVSLGLFFITSVLVVTALYVSFSPVGGSDIHGLQPRYLTPLLFPLVVFALNPKMLNLSKRWLWSLILVLFVTIPLVVLCANGVWLFFTA